MAGVPIEISVTDMAELREGGAGGFRLIDCREADEWDICHIEGAQLMPLTRFAEETSVKLGDRAERLIVYCHHGVRSLRAAQWLRQQGFASTQSMRGGIDAWTDQVDETMRRY